MEEIRLECHECHATIELPHPDAFTTGDGVTLPSDPSRRAEEVLEVVDYMRGYGCPGCGGHELTLADAV
jgi:Zn finger protein HypA/HybF involved in hydrogenase expression